VKLLLVGLSSGVCGGVIGRSGNGRFCTVDAAECQVESHKTKLDLKSGCVYIRHNRANQGWLHPCLPANSIPKAKLEELLKETDTVARFKTRINDLKERDALMVETVSETDSSFDLMDSPSTLGVDTPTAEEVRRAKRDVATPVSLHSARAIPRSIMDDEPIQEPSENPDIWKDNWNQLRELSDMPVVDGVLNFEEASTAVIADWGTLKQNLQIIGDRLGKLKEGRELLRVQVEAGLQLVDAKMKTVDTKIQLLHQAMGEDAKGSDDGAKSLWDVIAELREAQQVNEGQVTVLRRLLDSSEMAELSR